MHKQLINHTNPDFRSFQIVKGVLFCISLGLISSRCTDDYIYPDCMTFRLSNTSYELTLLPEDSIAYLKNLTTNRNSQPGTFRVSEEGRKININVPDISSAEITLRKTKSSEDWRVVRPEPGVVQLCGNDDNPSRGTVVPTPQFSISVSPNQQIYPFTRISFTPTPQNQAFSQRWNFGDGSDLEESRNPTHAYNVSGTYTVQLWMIDGANTYGPYTQTVEVMEGVTRINIQRIEVHVNRNDWDQGVLNAVRPDLMLRAERSGDVLFQTPMEDDMVDFTFQISSGELDCTIPFDLLVIDRDWSIDVSNASQRTTEQLIATFSITPLVITEAARNQRPIRLSNSEGVVILHFEEVR